MTLGGKKGRLDNWTPMQRGATSAHFHGNKVLSQTCLYHLAENCKHTGFCQMKWSQEKLNVTRLFSFLPGPSALTSSLVILHPVVRDGPLTHARQKPQNSKKGRRKYAMSSAHPPKTTVVLEEAYEERVFACVSV
ncbi:hypothetical protein PAMP_010017 [Pampus punctatissimus]